MIPKLSSLKEKLNREASLKKELEKVGDEIAEVVGETKVKIKRTSLKKAK